MIEGGPAADVLFGGANHDVIYAGAGPDQLFGEAGDDHLIGGVEPLDELYGGAGDNLLEWTAEQDVEHGEGCTGGAHDGGEEHDHEEDDLPPQSAHGLGLSDCDGEGHEN